MAIHQNYLDILVIIPKSKIISKGIPYTTFDLSSIELGTQHAINWIIFWKKRLLVGMIILRKVNVIVSKITIVQETA